MCNISRRRSVAVLCMMYKIRFDPIYPHYGAPPVLHVPLRVARDAFGPLIGILMRLLTAKPRSTVGLSFPSQSHRADPVFDGVGLAGFKSRAIAFLFALAARYLFVFYCFPFLIFLFTVWYREAGVFGLKKVTIIQFSSLPLKNFKNNNSNNTLVFENNFSLFPINVSL